MRKLEIEGRIYTDRDVFVIAEIGSNHGGDPELCEKMIIAAAKAGANAVKMQKRDNPAMFTKTALNRPYENEFSYGKTYGEHRQHLDWFGEKEFKRFKAVAGKYGILFFATPFEDNSVKFLNNLGMPLWKIASCDVTNIPLVKKVARYGAPMLISTGGCTMQDIQILTEAIEPINSNYSLLHCVSAYPNRDEDLNLMIIPTLRKQYPEKLIGFSSHHPGIQPLILARAMGASIFEVHFTLNRGSRGTDHGFSIEPKGLAQACEDIKRVRMMLGSDEKKPLQAEKGGFVVKMGKGVYLNKSLPSGSIVKESDICIKSPAGALKPYELNKVIGKCLIADCSTGMDLREEMFNE